MNCQNADTRHLGQVADKQVLLLDSRNVEVGGKVTLIERATPGLCPSLEEMLKSYRRYYGDRVNHPMIVLGAGSKPECGRVYQMVMVQMGGECVEICPLGIVACSAPEGEANVGQ